VLYPLYGICVKICPLGGSGDITWGI